MTGSGLRERLGESLAARRLARRAGYELVRPRRPPARPVGVKLELTYRCNLQCPFCYTDSPRRTRERAADLDDATWRRIAEETIELGAIEAVVTGGEPFLRRELAVEVIERLASRGVGVTTNTNGWFVDPPTADRLSAVPGLQMNLSVDGATPELHDAARGVPGSWERVVAAIDRLLARGVDVQVVHVVTPANQRHVAAFLDQMWLLGVRSVRLAVVVPSGAAAREGDWRVDRARLRKTVRSFRERVGAEPRVLVQGGTLASLAVIEDVAPAALLVRPNGSVLIDSLKPFGFGNARSESLAACWGRIANGWNDPRIVGWAGSIKSADRFPEAPVVPYLDDEVPIGVESSSVAPPRRAGEVPAGVPEAPDDGGDLEAARRGILALALARQHALAPVRVAGDDAERYVRILSDGRVVRLNRTVSLVMDACGPGTAADALDRLAARHPDVDRERLTRDALASVRLLREREILIPAR